MFLEVQFLPLMLPLLVHNDDDHNDTELVDSIDCSDASIALVAIITIDEGNYMEFSIDAEARASFPKFQMVTLERVRNETSCDIHLLQ